MSYVSKVRPSLLVVAVALLSVASVMLASTSASAEDDVATAVEMTNTLKFTPGTVTIEVGETVRWKNSSVIVHTVTDDPDKATVEGSHQLPDGAEPFDSGNLAPGATWEHTFETPGTYQYFCIPHEGAKMWGKVIVEPAD